VWCYGSEFSGQAMDLWAYQNGAKIDFSRPGKPTDNAFVESFNGTFRDECINVHWFETLAEAEVPGSATSPKSPPALFCLVYWTLAEDRRFRRRITRPGNRKRSVHA